MFTGIVEAVGKLTAIIPKGSDVTISVDVGKLDMGDVKLGDSIATNGVCLTVVAFDQRSFSADLSMETLKNRALHSIRLAIALTLKKPCCLRPVLVVISSQGMWMA